ncbi:MAG: dTDP-4-dehydrorhamnose 3,5-epimerase family protein [candidate division WOR-3 bacterium]
MIDGVFIKDLKYNCDERGRVMEILRIDDPFFTKFGQVYMTTNYPGVVKAWHCHQKQIDFVCCVKGMIKLVLYDMRENSKTYKELMEIFIGDFSPKLVVIPQGVYHGWKNIGEFESIVVSTISEPYNRENPDELRLPYNTDKIPYNWEIVFK